MKSKYCSNHCKVFAYISPSTENTQKSIVSKLNQAAFNFHSKHYRSRRSIEYLPTDFLGNRNGITSNRAPPRNF